MKDKKEERIQKTVIPMSVWAMAFVGVSLLYVIGLSFLSRTEGFGVKGPPSFDNYKRLSEPLYVNSLLLSLRLSLITTVVSLVLGYPFAYLISHVPVKKRVWLMLLLIVPFWTNALIRIYGWKILLAANGPINALLKAMGLIQKPLKLLYTDTAVLIGMVYAMFPFMVLPIYSSTERIDKSVMEAARDLGANSIKAFFTVAVPVTMPGILAGCVLTFIPSIGLFFLSDLLGGSNTVLWGNLVHNELLKSHDMPFAATLSVVLLVLTGIIIYIYRRLGGKSENMVF